MELEWELDTQAGLPTNECRIGVELIRHGARGTRLRLSNTTRGYVYQALDVTRDIPGRGIVEVEGRALKSRLSVGFGGSHQPLCGKSYRVWRMIVPIERAGERLGLVLSPDSAFDLAALRFYGLQPEDRCFEIFAMKMRAPYVVRSRTEAAVADFPFLERMSSQAPVRVAVNAKGEVRAALRRVGEAEATHRLELMPAAARPSQRMTLGYTAWVLREARSGSRWDLAATPLPAGGEPYLLPTRLVQVDDARVRRVACELQAQSTSVGEYINRVGLWVLDWSRPPTVRPHDAARFMADHGTCIEAGHAAVALLRAAGIPARPTYVEEPYPTTTELHCLPEALCHDGVWRPIGSMAQWYKPDRQLILQRVEPAQEQAAHSARDGLMAYPGPWYRDDQPICIAGSLACDVWGETAVVANEQQAHELRNAMDGLWAAWDDGGGGLFGAEVAAPDLASVRSAGDMPGWLAGTIGSA